tara:strand:+ start:935 stop:1858 length:924 start_codon:yes stop_codon:yes gene_type:complete
MENIIKSWENDNKILFIYGDKRGCGKKYIANKISNDYELIKCDPNKLHSINNIGIQSMFKIKKKKLVIYELESININDILLVKNIKIIIIIGNTYINSKLKKIVKKNIIIDIKLTESQYIDILKKYIVKYTNEEYIDLLEMYDFNLNYIINNYNLNGSKDKFFKDSSLVFLNNKYNPELKELFNLDIDYSLSGLHLLDNNNILFADKLKIYESIIISDNINYNCNLYEYKILNGFIIPYKIVDSLKIKDIIKYNKYISKSLIYINIIKNNDNIKIDDIIKSPNKIDNINKKKIKYINKLSELISYQS